MGAGVVADISAIDGQLALERSVVTGVCVLFEALQVLFTRWRMLHVSSELAFSAPHSTRRQAT